MLLYLFKNNTISKKKIILKNCVQINSIKIHMTKIMKFGKSNFKFMSTLTQFENITKNLISWY